MPYFPMMIDLNEKKILVIGGGREGENKVEILHGFHARITLIARDATEKAARLSASYLQRDFEDSDLDAEDFLLVVAATDDRKLNARISRLARDRGIPVNIVDDMELCTFIFPAIIKDGDVVCSVSSSGKSPFVAQYIKELITKVLPAGIGEINDRMGRFRKQAKEEIASSEARRAFLKNKLHELLH